MKLIRVAGVAASLVVSLVLTGCGDVYRPVVNPFTRPGGDPQTSKTAFVLNQGVVQPPLTGVTGSVCDTPPCAGTASQIDAPADTNMRNHDLGRSPVHMVVAASQVWAANRDDNSVSTFSALINSQTQTVSLPPGSAPNFVASTESGAVYVALPGTDPAAAGNVGVILPGNNALTQTVPVGKNPVAMVETPNGARLYVLNKGDGQVTSIATLDKKVLKAITVGTDPVWAVATADSKYVFVLNRNNGAKGSVSIISTATDTVIATISVGASADVPGVPLSSPMSYDSRLQRLYVANSTDGTLSVFDTSALPSQPAELSGSPVVLGNPSPNPVSVAPLANGSRVYVANSGAGTVSVVDALSLTVKTTIPVGTQTVGVVATGDSSKVIAVNHLPTVQSFTNAAGNQVPIITQQPGSTSIQTSNDTVVTQIPAPFQDPVNCTDDTPEPWLPAHAYKFSTLVVPSAANGKTYRATTAGTSGASEPANWCTEIACTVTDGTVTWTEVDKPPLTCPRQLPWFVIAN